MAIGARYEEEAQGNDQQGSGQEKKLYKTQVHGRSSINLRPPLHADRPSAGPSRTVDFRSTIV
jgi:hypothetical protein